MSFGAERRPDGLLPGAPAHGPFAPAMSSGARQIAGAFAQFHEQGRPLSGALRLGSLFATAGDEGPLNSLYAGAMASAGRIPDFGELRALIEAGRALRPQIFMPGALLLNQGAPPGGFYIVHMGHVQCGENRETAGPMSVHGAVGCFTGRPAREQVVAIDRVLALHLSQDDAGVLKRTSLGAASILARRIYSRLKSA